MRTQFIHSNKSQAYTEQYDIQCILTNRSQVSNEMNILCFKLTLIYGILETHSY